MAADGTDRCPTCGRDREATATTGRLLDICAAASYLGITQKALRARVARQQVPFLRLGGRIYFRRSQLQAWIEALQRISVDQAVEAIRHRHG